MNTNGHSRGGPPLWSAMAARSWRTLRGRLTAFGGTARWAVRTRIVRWTGLSLSVLLVSLAGVLIGVLLGGHVQADVGPFSAEVSITPSTTGDTTLSVPPLGALILDSHDGPAHLTVRLGALDQRRTAALINDPASLTNASRTALHDVTVGVVRVGLRTLAVSVLCTLALSALIFRNVRRVAASSTLALAIVAGSLGLAGLTLRPQSIEEPRYEGLLVNAPALVGDARSIANNYNKYAEQLQRLVGNVSQIFTTVSALPVYEPQPGTKRILHISDMHLNPAAWQVVRTIVQQFKIDAVVDTGDLTDWGSEPEASYVDAIGSLKVPYVYVRGNHDSVATAEAVAAQPNAVVLDNSIETVAGVRIAGIGDPRFTPDKSTSAGSSGLTPQGANELIGAGEQLAATIRESDRPVDLALVHDPASAGPLSGLTPLVLAGHTHKAEVSMLPQVPNEMPTRLMVEGSTGGAGLRGLEGEQPLPLSMSVLYLDQNQTLQAYDDVRVGGTGQAQVSLERHVLENEKPPPATPTPTRATTPTAAATPSPTRTR